MTTVVIVPADDVGFDPFIAYLEVSFNIDSNVSNITLLGFKAMPSPTLVHVCARACFQNSRGLLCHKKLDLQIVICVCPCDPLRERSRGRLRSHFFICGLPRCGCPTPSIGYAALFLVCLPLAVALDVQQF